MKLVVICYGDKIERIEDPNEVFNFDENNHIAISIIQTVSGKYEGLGLAIVPGGDEEIYEFGIEDWDSLSEDTKFREMVNDFYAELRSELHKAGY